MRHLLFYITLLISGFCHGQIQLERQVLSPFGINGSGSFYLSSTSGQMPTKTLESNLNFLTQGFEQPDYRMKELIYNITSPECNDGSPYILTIQMDSVCFEGEGIILFDGFESENQIELTESGEYVLEVNCVSGSTFSDTLNFEAEELGPCDLMFYNVITPENDLGYWHIDNIATGQFIENTVIIVDRWGNQVWEGSNYDNMDVKWEGKDMSDNELPQGTYYYLVEIDDQTFKGFIELIK